MHFFPALVIAPRLLVPLPVLTDVTPGGCIDLARTDQLALRDAAPACSRKSHRPRGPARGPPGFDPPCGLGPSGAALREAQTRDAITRVAIGRALRSAARRGFRAGPAGG